MAPAFGGQDDRVVFEADPDHRIATITLNNPAQRNSYDAAMRDSLARCLDRAAEDDDLTVVLLRGAGGVFSTGADMNNAYAWHGDAGKPAKSHLGPIGRAEPGLSGRRSSQLPRARLRHQPAVRRREFNSVKTRADHGTSRHQGGIPPARRALPRPRAGRLGYCYPYRRAANRLRYPRSTDSTRSGSTFREV